MPSRPDDPPSPRPSSVAVEGAPDGAPEEPRGAESPHPRRVHGSRLLRFLFHLGWIGLLPFSLALVSVWLLTPGPADHEAGGLRVFVGEQQVPAGIVLFTLFAMGFWRLRHSLPFAAAIGIGGRKDVPPRARARFEEAQVLLEEGRRILRQHRREVSRELTVTEREQVTKSLEGLESIMAAERFDLEEFDAAHARADRAVGEQLARWRKSELREYAESIGIAVGVALLLRAFVVEAFKIPSGSMIPTLMIGDHIFVNKFTYGPLVPWTDKRLFSRLPPTRGDVMVFKFPENKEQDFIKRAVAIGGDTLEVLDGRPVVNGWLAPHCRVGTYPYDGRNAELYIEFLEDRSYFTLYDVRPTEATCSTSEDCGPGLTCRGGVCGMLQGPYRVPPAEAWVMGDNRNNSHDSRSWRGGLGAGVPFDFIKGRAMFVWMSFGPGGGIATDRLFVNVMGRPQLPAGYENLQAGVDKCMRERLPVAQTTPPQAPPPRRPR